MVGHAESYGDSKAVNSQLSPTIGENSDPKTRNGHYKLYCSYLTTKGGQHANICGANFTKPQNQKVGYKPFLPCNQDKH